MVELVCFLIFLFAFFTHGYISAEVIDAIRGKSGGESRFFRYIFYSVINLGIWSWAYVGLYLYGDMFTYETTLLIFLSIVVASIAASPVFAVIFSKIDAKGAFMGLAERWGVPCGTLVAGRKIGLRRWAVVTMVNGEKFRGCFSGKAAASDESLYMETYIVCKNGEWYSVKYSDGIVLTRSQIATIEFMTDDPIDRIPGSDALESGTVRKKERRGKEKDPWD
jgi:hypothetical protein